MEDLWAVFCGQSNCSQNITKHCGFDFAFVTLPSSCINHGLLVWFDVLLLAMLLVTIFCNRVNPPTQHGTFTILRISSASFNTCLGLVYIGFGVRNLVGKLKNDHTVSPIHWWVMFFFHGFTWVLVGLAASLRGQYFAKAKLRILSISGFLFAGISCFVSLYAVVVNKEVISVKVALDFSTFIGASLLLLCTYKGYDYGATEVNNSGSSLYTPLNPEGYENESNGVGSVEQVSPFERAGVLGKMSFWWLNPLMKLGQGRTLDDKEMPKLCDAERAESCYLEFVEQLNKQKQDDPSSQSSILWTLVACHRKEIIITALLAIVKIFSLSSGLLLLNAFIEVAEGKEAFKHEGYFLAIALLISKVLESLSERQWFFRSRLVGLKVRSLLSAVIYRKQQRLSNAARLMHSGGEITNYVVNDAYRIGEFPFWFHQTWTTSVQLCIALVILFRVMGVSTVATFVVIVLTVLCNSPLAKLQHEFQVKLMNAQDERLKAISEALVNMKVLKLYAWEALFRKLVEKFRKVEYEWLSKGMLRRSYSGSLFWISPVLVSAATFGACYFLRIPLHASNVFTFVATLRLMQDPIRQIPDVIAAVIQARVAFERIEKFLEAPELRTENVRKKCNMGSTNHAIVMKSASFSWEMIPLKPTLRNISLDLRPGQKVAICGEVGSGKSTLLAAILGEVTVTEGMAEVYGRIAYVSQAAWIQTGTIRENILFGSAMDDFRYQETLRRCSLVKDLELLPYGDLTEIGERGVNLSGGQKQRIQLARALYQDADIYLLDDPFSAVDAHTATSLFNEYVMEALSGRTVLLVTHQVDFLPGFDCCLLMSNGTILQAGRYSELIASSQSFLDLVNAHKETVGSERLAEIGTPVKRSYSSKEIKGICIEEQKASDADQLIKSEEREVGDTDYKPYFLYLNQNKGYVFFLISILSHLAFVVGQILQNSWMASGVDNPDVSSLKLIVVYIIIGFISVLFLFIRSLSVVSLGMRSSKAMFTQLLNSLFRAPMSFYDSTPLGRILSRVSYDLSIVDLDVPFSFLFAFASTMVACSNLGVMVVITWQVLFVAIPVIWMLIRLQRYYFATAKELMRINGTTKSLVANHLAESVAGAMTIRAFEEEDRFFSKNLDLIDTNASPFFHNFTANEWLIQRLETLTAIVLASTALCMVLLPPGTLSSGFVGMALSYGLSLNLAMIYAVQFQCMLANHIISVERLSQYMYVPSEAPEIIEDSRPPQNWPSVGKLEIQDLQIRYRPTAPLVLRGISCTFEGGDKIGIVGRTGSGKTTLIGALFRLVEPAWGKIIVDGIDICSIGLHDLRSRFGIIPQDPTLFNGTVRFNLDPSSQHSDEEIWKVLCKCQLKDAVQEKDQGLDCLVVEDGSNWSMGQRQLFCLGRALLRHSRVLVLDEATASIDNATDMLLQKTIRTEFADCTVITVAHRIPTVMDCTKVLAISDGKLVEYDEPSKLIKKEGSLFGQLVKEYWSQIHSAKSR